MMVNRDVRWGRACCWGNGRRVYRLGVHRSPLGAHNALTASTKLLGVFVPLHLHLIRGEHIFDQEAHRPRLFFCCRRTPVPRLVPLHTV